MKKVLLLGAGMVAKPIVDYLLDNNFILTIASRTVSKANELIRNNPNGRAVSWTVDQLEELDELIAGNDLAVSLLPYAYHVSVAKLCLKHQKHMVTTSYVSPEMKALDQDARSAGILILNEIGVDPGFDHMTAMRIIHKVQEEGKKITELYSLCGALAAPEETDNPFKYKFSWSPKGVIMAGNNGARFLKNGKLVELPTEDLFKNPLQVEFPQVGKLEVYPNRDSMAYIDLYGLQGIQTMYRGTFRYENWCESLDAIKALGMVRYDKQDFSGKTYRRVLADQADVSIDSTEEEVAKRLKINVESTPIKAMKWLGLFSNEPVPVKTESTFDLTSDLMLGKMMLPKGARDMVVMLHSFLVEKEDGSKRVIRSRLLDFATEEDTSIARTVALPAAIAVKMILNNKIEMRGVHIPISRSIYDPILNELERLGIAMVEEWALPESEKLG